MGLIRLLFLTGKLIDEFIFFFIFAFGISRALEDLNLWVIYLNKNWNRQRLGVEINGPNA